MRRPTLRMHDFLPTSHSNGPGIRSVVWVQGCSLGCPGCFNPQTHSFLAEKKVETAELANLILTLGSSIEGITLSGGEPFQQAHAILNLLEIIKQQSNLSVLAFTGYTLGELREIRYASQIISLLDVLIAGRYENQHRIAAGLIGSTNKKLHFFTSRYTLDDLERTPSAEVIIHPGGEIQLTGIDPVIW